MPDETTRLIIHWHPGGRDAIRFGVSGDDARALGQLGQRRSLIVNSQGTVASFGPDGEPIILKEHLFGSWQYPLRP